LLHRSSPVAQQVPTDKDIAMPGLRDTLAKLALVRRRLDRLLKFAAQQPSATLGPTDDGRLREVAAFGSNPGRLRMLAYAPKDLPEASALVVALHGCTQTAAAYDYRSGWSTLADRHEFALLCPEQQHANNPSTCFTWFHPTDAERNRGEALSIRQMIEQMVRDHGIDRRRIFIVGLSAGGAMTSAMLAAYPEVFAGAAIIAGLPYGSTTTLEDAFEAMARPRDRLAEEWGELVRSASSHRGPWPRLSIWHGSADPIVHPGNAEQLVKQWTNLHALPAEPDLVQHIAGHERRVWRDQAGAEVIEAYIIAGMGHGVPIATGHGFERCGHVGPFHFNVGLSSSCQVAKFWGITAEYLAMSAERADTVAADALSSLPETPPVEAFPAIAARIPTIGAAQSFKYSAHTGAQGADAHGNPLDPREVIAAALQKAGLLVPPGSNPADDPRSIISRTLRSVGLLKE
jgi:feruloyl esterase